MNYFKTSGLTAILINILLFTSQSDAMAIIQKTETPEYRVLDRIGDIEIREYPELIMATAEMGSSYSGNSTRGFRTVASYIFGGNDRNEKISMTSPVVVDMSDTMRMSFIMPSGYKLDELPEPDNKAVELHKEKPRIVAVISFGGYASDEKLNSYRDRLMTELQKNNIITIGDYMFMGYNPPFKLINRRNEIAVEIQWQDTTIK